MQEQPNRPLTDTLAEALRQKDLLLILDNYEHLVEDAARLVDVLLDSCSRLRVLATSRESLGVAGEVRWMVPALSVPDLLPLRADRHVVEISSVHFSDSFSTRLGE